MNNIELWALEPKYCINPHDITILQQDSTKKIVESYTDPSISSNLECPIVKNEYVPVTCVKSENNFVTEQIQTATVKKERASPLTHSQIKTSRTSPGLTTELENFQDLTAWCHSTPIKMTSLKMSSVPLQTDELNTPIIEFGDFIFQSPSSLSINDDCYELLNVASNDNLSSECLYNNNINNTTTQDIQLNKSIDDHEHELIIDDDHQRICNLKINNQSTEETTCLYNNHINVNNNNNNNKEITIINDIIGDGKNEKSDKINSIFTTTMDSYNNHNLNNIIITKCSNNNIFNIPVSIINTSTSQSDAMYTFTGHESSSMLKSTDLKESSIELDDAILLSLSVNNEETQQSTTVTLNDENQFITNTKRKQLHLDFSNIWSTEKVITPPTILNTPEVINTALALDKSFNLINYITNDNIIAEEIPIIKEQNVFIEDEPTTSTTINDSNFDQDPSYTTPSETSAIDDDDDDFDYEPPGKKKRNSNNNNQIKFDMKRKRGRPRSKFENSDSDLSNLSGSNLEQSIKIVRRGRPPKRNLSSSSEITLRITNTSDNSTDTSISRYRELRDKNNEASRRSRLNRKLKEFQFEEEAKDLDVKNTKLKVQVQELEKLVNTMRNNLMQMLLKK